MSGSLKLCASPALLCFLGELSQGWHSLLEMPRALQGWDAGWRRWARAGQIHKIISNHQLVLVWTNNDQLVGGFQVLGELVGVNITSTWWNHHLGYITSTWWPTSDGFQQYPHTLSSIIYLSAACEEAHFQHMHVYMYVPELVDWQVAFPGMRRTTLTTSEVQLRRIECETTLNVHANVEWWCWRCSLSCIFAPCMS